jgi:hypothetical protein
MPKGPKGERRPADVNARAVLIAKIATGEIEETPRPSKKVKSGKAGAKARNAKLSAEQRSAIAKRAAEKRWRLA